MARESNAAMEGNKLKSDNSSMDLHQGDDLLISNGVRPTGSLRIGMTRAEGIYGKLRKAPGSLRGRTRKTRKDEERK